MEKATCPFCDKTFIKYHGNQLYCSVGCKSNQKAANQKKLYKIISQFRNGFFNNYKLFERLVPEHGIKHFPLAELTVQGLNSNCFYGWFTDDEKHHWYKVGPYLFTITRKDQAVTVTIKK